MNTTLYKTAVLFFLITIAPGVKGQPKDRLAIDTPNYKTAIGLRGGESSGLSIKHFTGKGAIEGIVSVWPNDLALFLLYEIHRPAFGVEGLNWYYGAGGHVAFYTRRRAYYYDRYGNYWWYRGRRGFGLGIDGIVGLEYKIPPIPLAISIDLKPFVEVNTDGNVYPALDPGIGIKLTF